MFVRLEEATRRAVAETAAARAAARREAEETEKVLKGFLLFCNFVSSSLGGSGHQSSG